VHKEHKGITNKLKVARGAWLENFTGLKIIGPNQGHKEAALLGYAKFGLEN
jgi:hypothetical protein